MSDNVKPKIILKTCTASRVYPVRGWLYGYTQTQNLDSHKSIKGNIPVCIWQTKRTELLMVRCTSFVVELSRFRYSHSTEVRKRATWDVSPEIDKNWHLSFISMLDTLEQIHNPRYWAFCSRQWYIEEGVIEFYGQKFTMTLCWCSDVIYFRLCNT